MKELIDFLKDFSIATTERVKFPLFNSFALSWVVFNWKPLMIILFSEQSIEGRISYVVNNYSHPLDLIIFPAIISVAYVLGLPYLKRELHESLDEINRKNRDNAYDYQISSFNKKLLLADKETDLELKKSANLDLSQLNQKVSTLNSEIEKLKKENIDLLQNAELVHKTSEDLQTINKIWERDYENGINRLEDLANRQQSTLTDILDSTREFLSGFPQEKNQIISEFLDRHLANVEYLRKDYEKIRFKLLTKTNNSDRTQ